jgi:AAA15 family ATPase/GTPase
MFLIYQKLKNVLDHGGVYFFDDLDTHLHPLVMRTIVQAFLNTQLNKFNAQLIFSNHDLIMMTNDILRRDEIYFVDKDKDECSLLYSFTDIVNDHGNIIRKDENFVKNYLLGKYRAIPKLTGLNSLKQ